MPRIVALRVIFVMANSFFNVFLKIWSDTLEILICFIQCWKFNKLVTINGGIMLDLIIFFLQNFNTDAVLSIVIGQKCDENDKNQVHQ